MSDYDDARTEEALVEAKNLSEKTGERHVMVWVKDLYMIDQCVCGCGWKSHSYFDGAAYARGEWNRHVREQVPSPQSDEQTM